MVTARRTRAQIVAANDDAIRSALSEMVRDEGWDGVTFTGVAKRSGLTVGAVYGRAENAAELGIDLWQAQIEPWFQGVYTDYLAQASVGSPSGVARALSAWDEDPVQTSVLIELLISSQFDPDLAEVIGVDATRILGAHCLPSTGKPSVSPHAAACAVLLTSFAFGRALALRAGVEVPSVTKQQATVLANYFDAPPTSRRLPKPQPLDWLRPLDVVDPTSRAVMTGALQVLGRVGYRRATIARIARAAGVPRGSVLSHYDDKAELIAEAGRRALIPPGEVWSQYANVVARHGPLVSRAMFLTDFLKPANRELWTVNLELSRTSRFVPALSAFGPGESVLERTHLGVMLTASLLPGLDGLPFLRAFLAGSTT